MSVHTLTPPASGVAAAVDSVPPWFLAYTKPRQESVAEANLLRQGFEVYLPLFRKLKRGTPEPVVEPMFPRYVFLRPSTEEQSLSVVRSTRGVLSLIRFGMEIARVPQAVVDRIAALEAWRRDAPVSELSALSVGQRVLVEAGPFKGLEGLVHAVSAKRVTVLLELLGRSAEVGFAHHAVTAA